MSEHAKGLIYVSITALLWAVLAIALKVGIGFLDGISIVWFRFTFSASVLLGYLILSKNFRKTIFTSPPYECVLSGLFLGFNYLCFMKGVELTSPSVTQILIQTGPLTLALLGIFYFKEEINKKQALGFILALFGFGIFYEDQLHSIFVSSNMNMGTLWILMGGLSWALYAVFQKKLGDKVTTNEANFIVYFIASLMFVFFCDYDALFNVETSNWLLLIFFGANTLIAYGCLAIALKKIPANQASIIITLNPLITIFIMAILSKQQVTWIQADDIHPQGYAGAFFVILGAILVSFFKTKKQTLGK